jgi:thiamine biosynthesis lipoprotein
LVRALVVAVSLAFAGCAVRPDVTLSGETLLSGQTMGSVWTVKIAGRLPTSAEDLRAGVQGRFDLVNQALSTYRADSALSRFNDDGTGEWLDIDPELGQVLGFALSLAELSGGAYDVTVGPLVNLWGFGPGPAANNVPAPAAIEAARALVGWRKVEVDAAGRARKEPGVRVDLSSLGKGRGVDRVAEYLDARGVTNYLIDLSGKLRARGRNHLDAPWRVEVEKPVADASSITVGIDPQVITLREDSVATAGDYRRFFESGGRHYSHIIDPRTGWPVTHSTVSATAIAADCMHADALATVLMAMPPDEALSLANRMQWPALLISRAGDSYRVVRSAAWPSL